MCGSPSLGDSFLRCLEQRGFQWAQNACRSLAINCLSANHNEYCAPVLSTSIADCLMLIDLLYNTPIRTAPKGHFA